MDKLVWNAVLPLGEIIAVWNPCRGVWKQTTAVLTTRPTRVWHIRRWPSSEAMNQSAPGILHAIHRKHLAGGSGKRNSRQGSGIRQIA